MPYPTYPNFSQQYPGYFNQAMQMQQPMQQPQMQLPYQNNSLWGKIVESMDVVKATDIPIDGNNYYFPKADGTEIYVKKWLGNGTTDVSIYKKQENVVEESKPEIDFAAMEDNIIDKLNSIDERISKIEKGLTPTKPVAKKEA